MAHVPVRLEEADAVEELDPGGGVQEDDAHRPVSQATDRTEILAELGEVDLEAEQALLEELYIPELVELDPPPVLNLVVCDVLKRAP